MMNLRPTTFRHLLILITIILLIIILINIQMSIKLLSVDYKVYGRVQGVFFRKYTKMKAQELELFGYVKNHFDGSVVGTVQGIENNIKLMKNWLSTTGSPHSHIDRCDFHNERVINDYEFTQFKVEH